MMKGKDERGTAEMIQDVADAAQEFTNMAKSLGGTTRISEGDEAVAVRAFAYTVDVNAGPEKADLPQLRQKAKEIVVGLQNPNEHPEAVDTFAQWLSYLKLGYGKAAGRHILEHNDLLRTLGKDQNDQFDTSVNYYHQLRKEIARNGAESLTPRDNTAGVELKAVEDLLNKEFPGPWSELSQALELFEKQDKADQQLTSLKNLYPSVKLK